MITWNAWIYVTWLHYVIALKFHRSMIINGLLAKNSPKIIILRIFRIVGHPRDPKREDPGYLTTFRGINAPKSGPFKYENNAQTLPKQLQNNLENWDFGSKFCSFWPIWGVVFDHFGGQKSRFLDFFKVVLELFKKCLGIVFVLKRPTFGFIYTSKCC